MGRHKTPTHIKQINGSAKKNPQRIDKNEIKPTEGLGRPPAHLTEQQVIAWHDIVDCAVPGVLMKSEMITLEIAARLLASFRDAESGQVASDRSLLVSMLSKFGMTPADRSKISMGEGEEINPFAALDDEDE